MGSYPDQTVFNPAASQLVDRDEASQRISSRESFSRSDDVEFNPSKSQLSSSVGKTTTLRGPSTTTLEQSREFEDMEFIPSTCSLERKTATQLKREIREPSATETFGFDKTMGKLKKEQNHCHNKPATKTTKANPVMVDMNRRGTGGFF